MYGKKGMSPLIATILLMAFAVALGAVIMNWSSNIPEGGPDCGAVQIQVRSLCIDNGQLRLSVRNTGTIDLSEIGLSISDPPLEVPALRIRDSRMARGQTVDANIPFAFSSQSTIGIIPSLANGDMCAEPTHTVQPIPNC